MSTPTIEHATRLWEFLGRGPSLSESDSLVVCCSYDLRVADRAVDLLHAGVAGRVIVTGRTGNWTRHIWSRPEARVFRDRMVERGVDADALVLEERATNFGENVELSRRLLPDAKSVVFVTKPNSRLRLALTVPMRWPGVRFGVEAPDLRFPDDVSGVVGILGLIEEMVGDIERIRSYPARGFQEPCAIPLEVEESWRYLVDAGFTGHLPREEQAE